jgi:thioredoxin-like negative regulator of GroEL
MEIGAGMSARVDIKARFGVHDIPTVVAFKSCSSEIIAHIDGLD